MDKKAVIVLKGGISSEREVSLRTGRAVEQALEGLGCQVHSIDVQSVEFTLPEGKDPVFICLHGTFGEDGSLQQTLENADRVYTGSGPEACALAFNKLAAREAFRKAGLKVAAGGAWNTGISPALPFVLKPVADGSSVGVFIIRDEDERAAAAAAAESHGDYMFEEYIEGREVTVGVLENTALPLVEIRPTEGFYDYENKYTPGKTEHLCPAPFDDVTTARIQEAALKAHGALGCEVYSRVDFLVPEAGDPVVLEVNTIPGMTELSLLPEAAAAAGISFPELCSRILDASLEVRG